MTARGRPTMDVDRGRELRAEGLSWRMVGIRLAEECGRPLPYQAASVQNACYPGPVRVARRMAHEAMREDREARGE